MPLIQTEHEKPIKLRLGRNLVRSLKRGHPWVFAEALRQRPAARPGSPAILLDNRKGREIARGFYDPGSPLAFRACTVEPGEAVDEAWAQHRFEQALSWRQLLFDETTTGFRLFNGEGDGLPGLVCDIYGDTAVLQLDGDGPAGFWHAAGIARRLAETLSLRRVYERYQARQSAASGQIHWGEAPTDPIPFLEQNIRFTADIIQGQKTGFFLDQRENRRRIGRLAAGRSVLNLFGYTGGFSVYAGLGGANQVLTVDTAGPALAAAQAHWRLNGLPPAAHQTRQADVFEFLAAADQNWDVVIADPPSFASSRQSVPDALRAYKKLVAACAGVTAAEGLLAVASCSSHINPDAFLNACEEGISVARRRATILGEYSQPPDHPWPLPFAEFRYLKFVLMRVD